MATIYLCLCTFLQVQTAPESGQIIEPYAHWVGKKCLSATLEDMEFTADKEAPKPVADSVFQVLAVKGRMIKIRDEANQIGWVQKRWLVLADEAPDFFTAKLREESHPYWYYQRAHAWELKGDLKKAVSDVTQAYQLYPENYLNLAYRARLLTDLEEYGKALKDWDYVFEKISDKNSSQAVKAYMERSYTYTQMGDHQKALTDLNHALKLDPKNVGALIRRGSVYEVMKEYDKALVDFNQAILLDDNLAGIYQLRSRLLLVKKEYVSALIDAEKAYVRSPNDYGIIGHLSSLLSTCPNKMCRDGKRALLLAKKAYDIAPQQSSTLLALAEAYAETGDFDKAIEWQKKLLADPKTAQSVRGTLLTMLKYFEQKKRPWHDDEKLP
jgi:tetratricopeptide (TPR) repeat protein